MRLDRLDHLVLTVADVDASCPFYTRVLGMEAVTFGQQKINLHPAGREFDPRAARPTPGSADLCFLTREPLARWTEHLRACGVVIEEGAVRRTGALGPIDSLYVRDPDLNPIEIAVRADEE